MHDYFHGRILYSNPTLGINVIYLWFVWNSRKHHVAPNVIDEVIISLLAKIYVLPHSSDICTSDRVFLEKQMERTDSRSLVGYTDAEIANIRDGEVFAIVESIFSDNLVELSEMDDDFSYRVSAVYMVLIE